MGQPPKKHTILLVEDEKSLQVLVKTMLEEAGHAVLAASSGTEAWTLFSSAGGSIDLVLTDLGLPGVEGWDLCRKLKMVSPELPIVVASGDPDSMASERLAEVGVSAFIRKPFSNEELLEEIDRILSRGNVSRLRTPTPNS